MRRVISLYLPRWPCDRVRWRDRDAPPRDKPLVLAATDGPRRIIASLDDAAAAAGLSAGMTITHAQSLLPDLAIMDASPDADHAALTKLALRCIMYSPLVTLDPPDGVFIDVAGSAHLFKGEEALIRDLVGKLGKAGFSARAVIADTPGCAWAVARYGEQVIVSPGRATEAIASLPVAALRLSKETVSALSDVGIERVAQLATKPRSSLRLRYGAEVLLRLDQAFGEVPEALTSLMPPEVPQTELRFAEPVGTPEDLQRIIVKLCEDLCPILEARGIGARRLDLIFLRVDNLAQAIRIGLSRPYRDPGHLAKLLGERLVLVDPGLGIEIATLTASWVEALAERQTVGRHVGRENAEAEIGKLVDTLAVRLGPQKIYRFSPVESALPERAVARVPALTAPKGLSWPENLPRPMRLLHYPDRIEVVAELPDHPPRLFIWRNLRHRVARADGPERILGEWWVSSSEVNLARDYYRIETEDGARFWVFRDGPADKGGRWWLHGVGEA